MKLDGELAFCHSNVGLEPESQSIEFNDNNPGSTGFKSGNKTMKENENVSIDLKRNEGNLVSTQYDMEVDNGLRMHIIDSENDNEAQIRNLVEPVSHSSRDTEFPDASFPASAQDVESAKSSPNVRILDPPEALDSFENSSDIYMDKCATEREPELIVCYKESNYHFIKDICVDEGVPAKDKVLFENSVEEKAAFKFLPFDTYENKLLKKDNIGINVPFLGVLDLPVTEESDKVPDKHHQSKDLMQRDEDATGATEKLADHTYKEMVLPGDTLLLQELDTEQTRPSVEEGDEVKLNHAEASGEPEPLSKHEESENRIEEEAVLASSSVDEPNTDILVSNGILQNGSTTCQFIPLASVPCSKEECHQVGCKCDETQNTPNPADGKSDDQAVTSQVCHSIGESSFAAIGRASSRINYSGPVPYSGSISLRSDSSTTSTRSFAFPTLQSEWNSSPVKMAKADRRHSRKHRGWRQGILCCRF